MQDGIHLPFESVLDFEILAVRIAEDDLPNLITILRVTQHTLFLFYMTLFRLCSYFCILANINDDLDERDSRIESSEFAKLFTASSAISSAYTVMTP